MPNSSYKLTPERSADICKFIAVGNRLDTAAAACGISRSVLHVWLRKGRSDIEKDIESVEALFCAEIDRAFAQAECRAVALINKAGQKDWRPLAYWLERRHSEHWGRKDTHLLQTQVRGELEGVFDVLQRTLSKEDYARALGAIASLKIGAGETVQIGEAARDSTNTLEREKAVEELVAAEGSDPSESA